MDGVWLKIQRAQDHYEHLRRAVPDSGFTFVPEVTDGGRRHIYRATRPPTSDIRLGAVLGDCVHNLRSSLDHLACQLVLTDGNQITRTTSFPITDGQPATGIVVSGGVDQAALVEIERLQPYHRHKIGELLGLLRDLDNFDKHRDLAVVAVAVAGAQTLSISSGTPAFGEAIRINPVENPPQATFTYEPIVEGAIVAWFDYEPPRVEPDPRLTLAKHLYLPPGQPGERRFVLPVLEQLFKTVVNVARRLGPFVT